MISGASFAFVFIDSSVVGISSIDVIDCTRHRTMNVVHFFGILKLTKYVIFEETLSTQLKSNGIWIASKFHYKRSENKIPDRTSQVTRLQTSGTT